MNGQSPQLVLVQDHHRITADLYDTLFVHSLLQHAMSKQITWRHARQSHKSTPRLEWHEFLDGLCFLSDSKAGGKSVMAIGVAQIARRFEFYTTTNRKYELDAVEHMKVVLQILHDLSIFKIAPAVAASRLTSCCIGRSSQRVHNYLRRLRSCIMDLEGASDRKSVV